MSKSVLIALNNITISIVCSLSATKWETILLEQEFNGVIVRKKLILAFSRTFCFQAGQYF